MLSQRLIQLMFLIPPGCCYHHSRCRSSETGHTPMEIFSERFLRIAQILEDGQIRSNIAVVERCCKVPIQ